MKKKIIRKRARTLLFNSDSESESEDDGKAMKDLCKDSSSECDENCEDPTNPNEVCMIICMTSVLRINVSLFNKRWFYW